MLFCFPAKQRNKFWHLPRNFWTAAHSETRLRYEPRLCTSCHSQQRACTGTVAPTRIKVGCFLKGLMGGFAALSHERRPMEETASSLKQSLHSPFTWIPKKVMKTQNAVNVTNIVTTLRKRYHQRDQVYMFDLFIFRFEEINMFVD